MGAGRAGRVAAVSGLVLAGLAAAGLLGEIAVRLAWDAAAPATEQPVAPRSPRETEAAEQAAREGLPALEGVFALGRRDARGVHKGLPFRTNRSGFRGPDLPQTPPEGVFRIAVGGDSITMGSGVLEEDAYPARLRQALGRESGARYEVLNLGLSGLNAPGVVRRIEKVGMPYSPHLVVYGFTLNDIEGPAYVSTIAPDAGPERLVRHYRFADSPSYLLRAVWPRLLALSEALRRPVGSVEHDYHHNYFENPEAWATVEAALDDLAASAARRDICVHLLIHTRIAQLNRLHPFLEVMDKVEAAGRARGFSVTQSFEHFAGRDPSALRISAVDPHPNAAGHALLARALLEGLREVPEPCWEAGPGGVPAALR